MTVPPNHALQRNVASPELENGVRGFYKYVAAMQLGRKF